MKSMREFDYFADNVKPIDVERLAGQLPDGIEGQIARHRSLLRRYRLFLGLAVLTTVGFVVMLSRFSDELSYAFRAPSDALELGDVATFTPADIPHNAFVSLNGI